MVNKDISKIENDIEKKKSQIIKLQNEIELLSNKLDTLRFNQYKKSIDKLGISFDESIKILENHK